MKRPGADCDACPLKDRPFVPGAPGKTITFVGEAPGYQEANKGVPFVGESGKFLRSALTYAGFSEDEIGFMNVVACHPKGNNLPPEAVKCCRLDLHTPWFALGAVAAKRLTGLDLAQARASGQASWHPAFILRTPVRLYELIWDLCRLERRVHDNMLTLDIKYTVIRSASELASLSGLVCVDLETEDLRWYTSKILSIGIAQGNHAYIIPKELVYTPAVIDVLRLLFSRCQVVGHNVTFDLRYLHTLGVANAHFDFDTMLAAYVLNENTPRDLKTLVTAYCDAPDYEARLIKAHKKSKQSYSVVPDDDLYEYNAHDVCYNLMLWTILEAQLIDDGLYDMPFMYPLMAAIPALVRLEMNGMPVDQGALAVLSSELTASADEVYAKMVSLCGREFNPNSWKQVAKIMYEHFRLPKIHGRGFAAGTTNKFACQALKERLAPCAARTWLDLLADHRSLTKMRSSFVDNLSPFAGRVYPSYRLDGAESGRMSATDPAIQTIPRPGTGIVAGVTWGERVRGSYVAPPGWKFLADDYGQAELRVAGYLSGDRSLLDAYEAGRDIHSETAAFLFGPDYTKEQRQIAKNLNFASIYSFSEDAFPGAPGATKAQTRALVRSFHELRSGLVAWQKNQVRLMHRQGYVETLTKRRRRFPLITDENLDEAGKSAINMPVQGMASDLTLMSFIEADRWIQESGVDAQIVALIHDEILLLVKESDVEYTGRMVREIMLNTAKEWLPMPWSVDIETGPDWGHVA